MDSTHVMPNRCPQGEYLLRFDPLDGTATNGTQRILDLVPTRLHERVSVILGSKNEVGVVASYH